MNGLEKKGLSHEHLRRLFVSLHLGHSRIDVVTRNNIIPDPSLKKPLLN